MTITETLDNDIQLSLSIHNGIITGTDPNVDFVNGKHLHWFLFNVKRDEEFKGRVTREALKNKKL